MTINKTTTDLSTLKINYLTQEMYEDALENEEINENELYITPGSGSSGSSAFIAEFNVTTLAEAVTEYNAGKTLICRYTDIADVVVYAPLIDVTFLNGSAEGFAFSVGGYGNYLDFLLSPNGWTLSEMSATSTPTNNKLPLFDSTAHMNSTDMTSQEVSDFVDNLDIQKVLKTVETKTLLWSNSATTFAGQTVSLDLSDYDYIEVWFYPNNNAVDVMLPNPLMIPVGEERSIVLLHNLGGAGVNENTGSRNVATNASSVVFGDYAYKNRRSGGTLTTLNTNAVPRAIYGVKIEQL